MPQHPFGMVAAGLGFDHRGGPGRGESRQQYRGFDLRRRHRCSVEDRQRIARTLKGQGSRPPSPPAVMLAPICSRGSRTRRIGRVRSDASPSNTAAMGQPATAPMTSRQPVPELPKSSGRLRRAKPATPTPRTNQANSPVVHLCPQRPHRPGGMEDIFALREPRNPGLADRQRAQDQRPVRNRLVPGNPGRAGQRPAGRFKRGSRAV